MGIDYCHRYVQSLPTPSTTTEASSLARLKHTHRSSLANTNKHASVDRPGHPPGTTSMKAHIGNGLMCQLSQQLAQPCHFTCPTSPVTGGWAVLLLGGGKMLGGFTK